MPTRSVPNTWYSSESAVITLPITTIADTVPSTARQGDGVAPRATRQAPAFNPIWRLRATPRATRAQTSRLNAIPLANPPNVRIPTSRAH